MFNNKQNCSGSGNEGKKRGKKGRFSLAGQQSHDVPVTREYTEFHQVSEHTENLQQELLQEMGLYKLR